MVALSHMETLPGLHSSFFPSCKKKSEMWYLGMHHCMLPLRCSIGYLGLFEGYRILPSWTWQLNCPGTNLILSLFLSSQWPTPLSVLWQSLWWCLHSRVPTATTSEGHVNTSSCHHVMELSTLESLWISFSLNWTMVELVHCMMGACTSVGRTRPSTLTAILALSPPMVTPLFMNAMLLS